MGVGVVMVDVVRALITLTVHMYFNPIKNF